MARRRSFTTKADGLQDDTGIETEAVEGNLKAKMNIRYGIDGAELTSRANQE